jgi:signal transduction histidine kinase
MMTINRLTGPFHFKSIERKILTLIIVTCGTIMIVTGICFSYYERYQSSRYQYQHISHLVNVILPGLQQAIASNDFKKSESILKTLRHLSEVEEAVLFDEKHDFLLGYHEEGQSKLSNSYPQEIQKKYPKFRIYSYPLYREGGSTLGTLYVVINPSYVQREVGRLQLLLMVELFCLLIVAYLCTYFFTRQILQPIQSLLYAAKQIQIRQNFNWQVPNPYHDEFGTLIDAFNTMLRHIENVQRYLDDIINCMPSCLVGLSPTWEITTWNRIAEAWSGHAKSALQYVSLGQALPMLQTHLATIQQAMLEQQITYIDPYFYEDHYYTAVIYPLSSPEMGCVIRLDDCTTQVKVEHTLIQHEKMMSVGGLAAGMAHELNNPLGGILQQAQNIERRLLQDLPANQQAAQALQIELKQIQDYCQMRDIPKFLSGMQSLGQRASDIIHRMLQFAKPAPKEMHPVSVKQLFEHTLSLLVHDPLMQSVIITEDIPQRLPEIPCIASEIEQVLFNIFQNALHAMQNSDQKILKFSAFVQEPYVCLQICDTGPGMDEVLMKKIFEPFFTTKPPELGTGLGLSVSYFIVNVRHRGDIFVTSELGHGACFKVCLPF